MSENLRLTVEYDGTDFCGFQWQPHVRTVAAVLESALERLFAQRVKVTAAGRTDSGVHAAGQVVSFCAPGEFPLERLAIALNALLPADCSVRDAARVAGDFSARFSARKRNYVYSILNRPQRSALSARYALHISRPLDIEAMSAGSRDFVGEHDFRAFCAGGADTTVRTVYHLHVARRGELVALEIAANGFLHHMVRVIVGTLVECGDGRRDPASIRGALASTDRSLAGPTAPARGLCLAGVHYDDYVSLPHGHPFAPATLLDGERAFP